MYAVGHEPEPVEKIRKPQWTVENTRATQQVVDWLVRDRDALIAVVGHNSSIVHTMTVAIERFKTLDPKVTA